MASRHADSANSSKKQRLLRKSRASGALLPSASHLVRVTPDYNFLISLIDKGCRRVTLLVTDCSYGVLTMPCDLMRVLEKPVTSALRVLVASATLVAPLAAVAGNINTHPGFAGVY